MRRARIFNWFQEAGATALSGPWQLIQQRTRAATRTGGPDDDDDDEDALLRKLMPILAGVIVIAVVFGR